MAEGTITMEGVHPVARHETPTGQSVSASREVAMNRLKGLGRFVLGLSASIITGIGVTAVTGSPFAGGLAMGPFGLLAGDGLRSLLTGKDSPF